MQFPPVPPEVKGISHFLKVAEEHEKRNIVVAYWARMFACQRAMQLMPEKKPPPVSKLLIALMDWMEETKKSNATIDGIINETAAQAIIEDYALQLFAYGDAQDRAQIYNKNTVKAFYTAGILMDILEQFGNIPEDILNKKKYAKWKAAYIHNCLKAGDTPVPGAADEQFDNLVHKIDLEPENIPTLPGDAQPPFNLPEANNPQTPSPPQDQPPAVPPKSVPLAQPTSTSSSVTSLPPEKIKRAQKLCKFAESALDYDDLKTAVDNLTKALHLIQTGEEL